MSNSFARQARRGVAASWPAGALEACEALELCWPAWFPVWRRAGALPWVTESGFYAYRRGMHPSEPIVFGATIETLAEAIEDWLPTYPLRVSQALRDVQARAGGC